MNLLKLLRLNLTEIGPTDLEMSLRRSDEPSRDWTAGDVSVGPLQWTEGIITDQIG